MDELRVVTVHLIRINLTRRRKCTLLMYINDLTKKSVQSEIHSLREISKLLLKIANDCLRLLSESVSERANDDYGEHSTATYTKRQRILRRDIKRTDVRSFNTNAPINYHWANNGLSFLLRPSSFVLVFFLFFFVHKKRNEKRKERKDTQMDYTE